MQRYVVHLANIRYTPKDAHKLLNTARDLLRDTGSLVVDTRVSARYIELDTFIPECKSINDIVEMLVDIMPVVEYEHIVEKNLPKEDAIRYGISLFNHGKYWQSHEILESVWKDSKGGEKDLLNGLILIAAAFVHDQKDEGNICISILQRAMKKLENSNGTYFGIEVDKVKAHVMEILDTQKIDHFAL